MSYCCIHDYEWVEDPSEWVRECKDCDYSPDRPDNIIRSEN